MESDSRKLLCERRFHFFGVSTSVCSFIWFLDITLFFSFVPFKITNRSIEILKKLLNLFFFFYPNAKFAVLGHAGGTFCVFSEVPML